MHDVTMAEFVPSIKGYTCVFAVFQTLLMARYNYMYFSSKCILNYWHEIIMSRQHPKIIVLQQIDYN